MTARARVALEDPATGWKYRGPKPVPVLENDGLSFDEKVAELERVVKKLRGEFWLRERRGLSRLALARALYYEALADYQVLTNSTCPPAMNCSDLPKVKSFAMPAADGTVEPHRSPLSVSHPTSRRSSTGSESSFLSEMRQGAAGSAAADRAALPLEPDISELEMPECLATGIDVMCDASQGLSQECLLEECPPDDLRVSGQQDSLSDISFFVCSCLKRYQEIAVASCSEVEKEMPFLSALNQYEQARCMFSEHLQEHIGFNPVPPQDLIDPAGVLLQTADQSTSATKSRGLARAARRRDLHVEAFGTKVTSLAQSPPLPGTINMPPGCNVSNPAFLGDGQCDGDHYNNRHCNFDGGDCCEATCRSNLHACGSAGYECKGDRVAVKYSHEFDCEDGNKTQFEDFFESLRDELATGLSKLHSARCSHIAAQEHHDVVQAFNVGVRLGQGDGVPSSAQLGGQNISINCAFWADQMDSPAVMGSLLAHVMGLVAGYDHPDFQSMVYESECRSYGDHRRCDGHCMEWTTACKLPNAFGSMGCAWADMGCKTTCVKSDYCMSLPERMTQCFGFEKVHSRPDIVPPELAHHFEDSSSWSAWFR